MTLPLVVEMTVDAGNSYELSAETNQHEINLDNELEINVVSYDVPEYQGSYTVDAGLSPVVLNTQDKRLTQNVTVNALQAISPSSPSISVNSDNGYVTATAYYPVGYNDLSFVIPTVHPLPTQSAHTYTPSNSEQTILTKGTYLTGNIKLAPISLPYADVSDVTASASDVLAGKYFVNNLGVLTLGTAIAGGGDGAPMPVETVAEMIDTTKVYLYVGSEAGYTFGNWYYYDGNDWVSGGKWGADGGVNTNARNLLDYILERVAYTETGMQVYVDALYEALAQAGAVTTTYTITNALSHVTNSNTATGCEEGDSYTGTLTADTDYTIDTVTVTMGGVDITSTAYNNGVITIASVTGNIVITASASEVVVTPASTYITVANETLTSGYINDQGTVSQLANNYFIDKFYEAVAFASGYNGELYAPAGSSLRSAYYDANQSFLSRVYGTVARVLEVANQNAVYQKIGWASRSVDYAFLLQKLDSTLFVNNGYTINSSGDLSAMRGEMATDLIPFNNCDKYVIYSTGTNDQYITKIAFYDGSQTFISRDYTAINASNPNGKYGDIPSNAVYYRMSIKSNDVIYNPLMRSI